MGGYPGGSTRGVIRKSKESAVPALGKKKRQNHTSPFHLKAAVEQRQLGQPDIGSVKHAIAKSNTYAKATTKAGGTRAQSQWKN